MCVACFRKCEEWISFRRKLEENALRFRTILEQDGAAEDSVEYLESEEEMKLEETIEEEHVVEEEGPAAPQTAMVQEECLVEPQTALVEIIYENQENDEDVNANEQQEDEEACEEEVYQDQDGETKSISDLYPIFSIECSVCQTTFPHCNAYNEHLREHYDDIGPKTCKDCPGSYNFESASSYRHHMYIHTKIKFTCPLCPSKCSSRVSLISHLKVQHKIVGQVQFRQCNICGLQVKTAKGRGQLDLKKHLMDAHVEPDQKECYLCGTVMPTDRLLAHHLFAHGYSTFSKFCCDICAKVFHDPVAFKQHQKTHQTGSAVTRVECDVCHKSYKSAYYLEVHKVRHSSEKKFKCPDCGKMYYLEKELRQHQRTHAEDNRSYKCRYCNRGFFNNSTREEHVRIRHTFERRFPCDMCGRAYYRRRELEEHQRSHTGEKPFTCDVCGRIYSRKTTLMTHKKMHRDQPKAC